MQLSSLAVLTSNQAKRVFVMLNQIAVSHRYFLVDSPIRFHLSYHSIDLISCAENIIIVYQAVGIMPRLTVSSSASIHNQRYICQFYIKKHDDDDQNSAGYFTSLTRLDKRGVQK